MKFLCGGCSRLDDVERFRLDGAVLVITCTQCGAESRATENPRTMAPPALAVATVTPLRPPPEPVALLSNEVFEVPAGHCPKCISKRQAGTAACPSCGLVFSSAAEAFIPSEWLKGEWVRVLQGWAEEPLHDALRVAAMNQGELAELGRLYRLRLARTPGDPDAKRGLDEVLRLAVLPQVSLEKMKGPSDVPRWKYVALSAVIVVCLMALFYLVRQMLTLS